MRWRSGRRSSNIDDRRAQGGGGRRLAGGSLVTLLLIAGVGLMLGVDPAELLSLMQEGGAERTSQPSTPPPPEEDELVDFVSVVLADTEDVWTKLLPPLGRSYEKPKLVLFRDRVSSACGRADASVGPFYCPGDHQVYLDLSFFDELDRRFGAPGDFAQAYVIGHEIGHHVQTLLGTSERVRHQGAGLDRARRNALSVRQELQADCYAGVWAHHADRDRNLLEEGDLEEGLAAAAAIGDDRLQRQSGRAVAPESFTHGSSEQRMRWFRQGIKTGDPTGCDTFAASP